jgi:GntR family transcriptional regulator
MAFTEHRLCEQYGVSRTTVRQALQELAGDGLLVRLQGKGTAIVPRKQGEVRPLWVFGSLEDMIAYGHETAYKLIDQGATMAPRHVAELLKIQADAPLYHFLGTRSTGGLPFVAIETWLPYPIGVQILPHLGGNSPITALVDDKLGIHVAAVEQAFSAAPAPAALRDLIEVKRGRPVLVIRRLYFDGAGTPVGLSINYGNSDRFQYRVRLQRRSGGG